MQSNHFSSGIPMPAYDSAAFKLDRTIERLYQLGLSALEIMNLQETLGQYNKQYITARIRFLEPQQDQVRSSIASSSSHPTSYRSSQLSDGSHSVDTHSSVQSSMWSQDSFSARASLQFDPTNSNRAPFTDHTGSYPTSLHNTTRVDDQHFTDATGISYTHLGIPEASESNTQSLADFSNAKPKANLPIRRFRPQAPKPKPIHCPEPDCTQRCTDLKGFKSHIKSHLSRLDQTHEYQCKHYSSSSGTMCANITYTNADFEDHHATHTPTCTADNVLCRSKLPLKNQKLWACCVCSELFESLDPWADHYTNHFLQEHRKKKDIDYSKMIYGLLDQPKTQAYWHERRKAFCGENLQKQFTWNMNDAQVRSLVLTLTYGKCEEDPRQSVRNVRVLVDKAVSLGKLPDFLLADGLHSPVLKRRATSSPAQSQPRVQCLPNSYGLVDHFGDDSNSFPNIYPDMLAMDGVTNQYQHPNDLEPFLDNFSLDK